jgi:hypothetical protein
MWSWGYGRVPLLFNILLHNLNRFFLIFTNNFITHPTTEPGKENAFRNLLRTYLLQLRTLMKIYEMIVIDLSYL